MSLFGKNLRLGDHGPDLAELHHFLRRAGMAVDDVEVGDRNFGVSTRNVVIEFQRGHDLDGTGVVDDRTVTALMAAAGHPVDPPEPVEPVGPVDPPQPVEPVEPDEPVEPVSPAVRGQVMYRRGLAITGVLVRALHRRLRDEVFLGETVTTDDRGEFAIPYSTDGMPGGRVDLQVRVFADAAAAETGTAEASIAQSKIFYDAAELEKVRLQVDGGPDTRWTEYQQTVAEITDHTDGVDIGDLDEKVGRHDLSLLAGKTNQPLKRLADLVVAHRLSADTTVSPETMYAVVRRGIATDLTTLANQSEARLQAALQSAADRGFVPVTAAEDASAVVAGVRTAVIDTLAAREDGIGGILRKVDDVEARKVLVGKLIDYDAGAVRRGEQPGLWEAMRQDDSLREAVPALQASMQLAALSGEHEPMVAALSDHLEAHPVAALAAYSVEQFQDIISALPADQRVPASVKEAVAATVPADATPEEIDALQVSRYATQLHRIVADTMPTLVLAHTLKNDENASPAMRTFWTNVASADQVLDLRAGLRIDDLPDSLFDGVDDREVVTNEISAVKRLFNITTNVGHVQMLRGQGLDSAQAIAEMGASTFIKRFAEPLGGEQQALSYAIRAAHISATSAALFSSFSASLNDIPMYVLPAYDYAGRADLETLFGSADLCDCEHCQSILSPAAYLAETLAWLRERKLPDGKTALDELLRRRGDIGEIELSCENTNTVLPYIDLAIELLENLISPPPVVTIDAAAAGDLDTETIPAAVRDAFDAAEVPLRTTHECRMVTADQHWFLTDRSTLWVVRRSLPTTLTATFGSYQTSLSSDELATEPEHQNGGAYKTLRAARFPLTAPLDLWTEEVRTYLGHLLSDADAMPTYRRELMAAVADRGVDPLTDVGIARESLGLTVAQADLVLSRSADPWRDYGLDEDNNQVKAFDAGAGTIVTQNLSWSDTLQWVSEALRAYGVEYPDLVGLLATDYVNPGRAIRIESADPSDIATCDVRKLKLIGIDLDAMERLRRFVRLRTALGWTPRELDDIITALRADVDDVLTRIDTTLLVSLAAIARLRGTFGITLSEMPALWAVLRADRPDDLYFKLFGGTEFTRPADVRFAVAAAAEGAMEIVASGDRPTITEVSSVVMAALGLTAGELTTLAAQLPSQELKLATLSTLYRWSRLARALALSVDELVVVLDCADDPFPPGGMGPVATERFTELVGDMRESGLSIGEIDYLLFHQASRAGEPAGLSDADVTDILEDLRAGLRDVAADTSASGADSAEALRRWFGQLRWPGTVVDEVVSVLDGSSTAQTDLAVIPAGLAIPGELQDRVTLAGGKLRVRGALSTAERDELLAADADASYQAAVGEVFTAPRDTIGRYLTTWRWPKFSAPLAAMAAGVELPADLRARVYHDPAVGALISVGPLTVSEIAALKSLSADAAWTAAVDVLDAAIDGFAPDPAEELLTDPGLLLDTEPTDRLYTVATELGGHLRASLSESLVITRLAARLDARVAVTRDVLTNLLVSDRNADQPGIADFLDPVFASSHAELPASSSTFDGQRHTCIRVDKLLRLIGRLRMSATQLSWLATYAATVSQQSLAWKAGVNAQWWRPASVPVTASVRSAQPLGEFLRVTRLARLTRAVGEDTMDSLLRQAKSPSATLTDLVSTLATGVSTDGATIAVDDLAGVIADRDFTKADFIDEQGASAQVALIEMIRRTGASAAQLAEFAKPESSLEAAQAARQVVKSRYARDQWHAIAAPLRDVLRRKQRDALLAYVLADPEDRWPDLTTEADVYRHVLLDSETEPIVDSSRIKQALSSVQLYVQSAMMNLVTGVETDAERDPGWRDWAWMKNYRVWEANRKVFCYPENWLDPSLRDDKTPLFGELESALMRDDVTADVVNDAFEAYLAGLDDIARLEILGEYEVGATAAVPAMLYVIGRSRGRSPNLYWRRRVGGGRWTAWQLIDVDITEPQVLPVVWNGRLHLFWPVFTAVTPQEEPADKPTLPTNRRYHIALAYSYFHRGKWQPKQLTEVTISTPLVPDDANPEAEKIKLVLRAFVGSPDLWVWPEFDDPDVNTSTVKPGYTPPMSQSVYEIYSKRSGFHFTGRSRQVVIYSQDIAGIFEPSGTTPQGMLFVQDSAPRLNLPSTLDSRTEAIALSRSPSTFSLAYAHQDQFITGARTFFFQDGQRCYIVDPLVGYELSFDLTQPEKVTPGLVGAIKDKYYNVIPEVTFVPPGPVEIVENVVERFGTTDPLRLALLRDESQTTVNTLIAEPIQARVDLFKSGDQRRVISKSDKAIVQLGDYVSKERIIVNLGSLITKQVRRYQFKSAFHPYVGAFQEDLTTGGVEALVRREGQQRSAATFKSVYEPQSLVQEPYPVEDVDFEPAGFMSQYNWELFFHAPMLIATRLSANQRFEEAQRWFHLIFDPTDTSHGEVPARFWQTRPLHELSRGGALPQRLSDIIAALAAGTADPGLLQQVSEWRSDPFNPFAISRLRLGAFQKMVVMAYLDNLIAWADQLFRQDTIETINYATNLYMLAADILGRRPRLMAPRARPEIRTSVSLNAAVTGLSNAFVDIEQQLGSTAQDSVVIDPTTPPLSWPKMLYFGIPKNDKLFGYWDTVADRLFKIRNSMNIEGVTRTLPLFEPPIDPALLVRARAAGLDIAAVLSESYASPPVYRFRTLANEALTLTADVQALGAALLSALEKRDAEALALLRATNETALSDQIEGIKEKQQDEAREQISVLRAQRAVAVDRYTHFQRLLGVTKVDVPPEDKPITLTAASANAQIASSEGVKLLNHDKAELDNLEDSRDSQVAGAIAGGAGSTMAVLPTVSFKASPWGVGTGSSWGGGNLAAAASAVASVFSANAAGSAFDASKSSRLASAVVREHDWVLQSNQAALDIMSIDRQRLASEIRLDIATKELDNHRTVMRQSRQASDFLADKYTNAQLYDWMSTQISATYFQSYQIAYDLAKKAEYAMQRELGSTATQYIQFGYWDSAHKGLLAGERLRGAINRMHSDYLERNRRTYEITKHVSIANINPAALIELRETGSCTVMIPEALFDLDRPGDYCRRLKMVSLSLPCVTGPYTGVHCTMTLLNSQVRVAATPTTPYPSAGPDDQRFTSVSPVESVVTSSARDDSGMFVTDFNDERFLPFEGAGAIGTWRLELPATMRQFDYQTITDAVITLRYTALNGGPALRAAAVKDLQQALQTMEVGPGTAGLYQLMSVQRDDPDSWYQLLHPSQDAPELHTLRWKLEPQSLPYARQGKEVDRLAVVLRCEALDNPADLQVELTVPGRVPVQQAAQIRQTELGGLPTVIFEFAPKVRVGGDQPWILKFTALPDEVGEQVEIGDGTVPRLLPDALHDVGLLWSYQL